MRAEQETGEMLFLLFEDSRGWARVQLLLRLALLFTKASWRDRRKVKAAFLGRRLSVKLECRVRLWRLY